MDPGVINATNPDKLEVGEKNEKKSSASKTHRVDI